ncbi:MAG TPA: SIS domain-containing protein [Solirubrobacteraceae bacterium]|nr:SIS domain-containing protein [Solirubrobacteraceae bacterium]
MSVTESEITTQPEMWERTAALLPTVAERLPAAGRRLAVIGCGTSYFIAQAIAVLRESGGAGETDAFVASEMPAGRAYEEVLAISRSGTTTEVLRALEALPGDMPSLVISAVDDSPVVQAAGDSVLLEFADERSIVQTRFATCVLALLRMHLGEDITPAVAQARAMLHGTDGAGSPPPPAELTGFEQFVFLGHGWSVGIAAEAALKFREASLSWAEAYPAGEYRHGPISVAGPRTLVWLIGLRDDSLVADIESTGATVRLGDRDPMAELVAIQLAAAALAQARGLDPDRPRHLRRSVVLSPH